MLIPGLVNYVGGILYTRRELVLVLREELGRPRLQRDKAYQ